MHKRYIVVVTRSPKQVPAYLYSHTTVEGQQTMRVAMIGDVTYFLLETSADSEDRAQDLAEYQAQRLDSGLHYSTVHPTRKEAVAALAKSEVYL